MLLFGSGLRGAVLLGWRSRGREVVERPTVELFYRVGGFRSQLVHLLAGLGYSIARASHLVNEFLRRLSVLSYLLCRVFKQLQHLTNAPLFTALYVGQSLDAFATCFEVVNDRFELSSN